MRRIIPMWPLLVLVAACSKNPHVEALDKAKDEACECGDADCAKDAARKFFTAWDEMYAAEIDWKSSEGKKVKKGAERVGKAFWKCVNEHNPAGPVTKKCQKSDEAQGSSDACKKCCRENGRMFKQWNDPLAGKLGEAFGAKLKGCVCK